MDNCKCIICDKEMRMLKHMPHNLDKGVDLMFTANYGSTHDMCIMRDEQFKERALWGAMCDECFSDIKDKLVSINGKES